MWLKLGTKLRFGTWGYIGRGSGLPGEVRVISPIGIVGITIWSIGLLWLVLSYSIAHSDIKSFTVGAIGYCSSGWVVDWKLVQGLDCA